MAAEVVFPDDFLHDRHLIAVRRIGLQEGSVGLDVLVVPELRRTFHYDGHKIFHAVLYAFE